MRAQFQKVDALLSSFSLGVRLVEIGGMLEETINYNALLGVYLAD